MNILVINGPNLNLLGKREPIIYGSMTLNNINDKIKAEFIQNQDLNIEFFQNNIEGEIINKLHSAMGKIDGIVINAGAYTHTSLAISDAIKAIDIPTVEVHMSNIYSREEVRHKSFLSACCVGQISGFGYYSYILAIHALVKCLQNA